MWSEKAVLKVFPPCSYVLSPCYQAPLVRVWSCTLARPDETWQPLAVLSQTSRAKPPSSKLDAGPYGLSALQRDFSTQMTSHDNDFSTSLQPGDLCISLKWCWGKLLHIQHHYLHPNALSLQKYSHNTGKGCLCVSLGRTWLWFG